MLVIWFLCVHVCATRFVFRYAICFVCGFPACRWCFLQTIQMRTHTKREASSEIEIVRNSYHISAKICIWKSMFANFDLFREKHANNDILKKTTSNTFRPKCYIIWACSLVRFVSILCIKATFGSLIVSNLQTQQKNLLIVEETFAWLIEKSPDSFSPLSHS